jgi:hypothetical protein
LYLPALKKCLDDVTAEDPIAVAHDDDLQLIEDEVNSKSK